MTIGKKREDTAGAVLTSLSTMAELLGSLMGEQIASFPSQANGS